jgi:hypothetical protein
MPALDAPRPASWERSLFVVGDLSPTNALGGLHHEGAVCPRRGLVACQAVTLDGMPLLDSFKGISLDLIMLY